MRKWIEEWKKCFRELLRGVNKKVMAKITEGWKDRVEKGKDEEEVERNLGECRRSGRYISGDV